MNLELDARTHAQGELRLNDVAPLGAWQLVPVLAMSWSRLNVALGVGYGWRWLPGGLMFANRGVVLDLDLFFRC